jgi:hypothetical protein
VAQTEKKSPRKWPPAAKFGGGNVLVLHHETVSLQQRLREFVITYLILDSNYTIRQ